MPVRYYTVIYFLVITCLSGTSFASQLPIVDLFTAARKYIDNDDYQKAVIEYGNCLKEAAKIKDTIRMGNAHIGLGIAYEMMGNYENCLNNYFSALAHYESIGNKKKIAGSLKNIGNVYRILKSFDQSQNFFQQALARYTEIPDSTGISTVMNDLGIMNMDQKKFAEAKSYFETILTLYYKYLKEEVKAFAFNNLADVYKNQGKYEEAYGNYQSSLTLMKKINSNRYGLALVYFNLSELFLLTGDLNKAIAYGNNSIAISQDKHLNRLLALGNENMANTYIRLKDYKQASKYLSEQIKYKDTIFKEESAKSYAEMETKYENVKKKKEILELEQQNTIKNGKIKNQQLERNFLLTGMGFIVLISIILYWNYYIKQQVNKKLNLLNTKLNEANHSKTKLLGILSHDLRSPVSSLFSFLQFQKQSPGKLTKPEQDEYNEQISLAAENLLEAMEDLLIWSKSQMENFSPVFEDINISVFFDDVIKVNETAARNKNIKLQKVCLPDVYLHTDSNFLKIIFRNLTSNAIKFTPEYGNIELSCIKKAEALLLTVKDNGAGIAANDLKTIFEWNSIRSDSSGLGLKLAREFAEKLHASITVDSALNEGTSFTLAFPLSQQKIPATIAQSAESKTARVVLS